MCWAPFFTVYLTGAILLLIIIIIIVISAAALLLFKRNTLCKSTFNLLASIFTSSSPAAAAAAAVAAIALFTVYLTGAFCGDCTSQVVFHVFFWLGYCNSAVNPFIYGLCSRDFRYAFTSFLRCEFARTRSALAKTRLANGRMMGVLQTMTMQIVARPPQLSHRTAKCYGQWPCNEQVLPACRPRGVQTTFSCVLLLRFFCN